MVRTQLTALLLPAFITVLCDLVVSAPVDAESSSSLPGGNSTAVSSNNNSSDDSGAVVGPVKYYTTKYDHVDIEAILNNRRMVNYYSKCLLSQGPCSPDGLEFKRILPDAIRTNCIRCTEKQKAVTTRTIKRLIKEYPKVWAQLAHEWDRDNIYVKKFLDTWGNWEYKPPTTPAVYDRFEDDENKTSSEKRKHKVTTESTNIFFNLPPLPSISPKVIDRVEPIANNIGAGITATVSLGNRVVSDVLRGITAIGNRVVETGAGIADVVLKTISRPL